MHENFALAERTLTMDETWIYRFEIKEQFQQWVTSGEFAPKKVGNLRRFFLGKLKNNLHWLFENVKIIIHLNNASSFNRLKSY